MLLLLSTNNWLFVANGVSGRFLFDKDWPGGPSERFAGADESQGDGPTEPKAAGPPLLEDDIVVHGQ